jgi:succinoglycan biosynthesis protein ExoM
VTVEIAICVVTYKRPTGLGKLLAALDMCELPAGVSFRVVVVDNDSESTGQVLPSVHDWELEHVIEPQQGIPFARNTAVRVAGDVDAIMFFDDDEQPRSSCLLELVRVWRETGASVVQGGSNPVFEVPPPAWVEQMGYFERRFKHDAAPIEAYRARTSNVLIDTAVFAVADPPFDTRLKLSGGSDSFLFRSAEEVGHRFVASSGAIVDEDVPTTRVNSSWLVRRQYRTGWGRSFHLRAENVSASRRIKRVGAGLTAIGRAPLAAWGARGDGVAMWTEARRSVAYGRGLIVGLLGRAPEEYGEIHGK